MRKHVAGVRILVFSLWNHTLCNEPEMLKSQMGLVLQHVSEKIKDNDKALMEILKLKST